MQQAPMQVPRIRRLASVTDLGGAVLVNAVRKKAASPDAAIGSAASAPRAAKIRVFLVTADDGLWPQIGTRLEREFILKQVDTIEELHASTEPGEAAIIIWDARGHANHAQGISDLQRHSPRLALVVIDAATGADAWVTPLKHRQIAAVVALPIEDAQLSAAIAAAREELHARTALLGASGQLASPSRLGPRRWPFVPLFMALGALLLGAAAYYWISRVPPPTTAPASAKTPAPSTAPTPSSSTDDTVFNLLEKARQAMLDRRFIDPPDGSALTLYREVLKYDPANGEAQQALQRLAQVLFARVQSSLDERKYDIALQALETARSISPGDPRLAALDARVATVRAEVGPAQIQAAINAKSFDRAAQLLDEAARAKLIGAAKLAQLRDALLQSRSASDVERLVKLIDTRLQQDKLVDPRDDSAAYYLQQARTAGASDAELQAPSQELSKRLLQAARTAIDQRQLADVDRWLAEARSDGAAAQAVAALQNDLTAARKAQAKEKAAESQLLEAARARLAQGKLVAPDKDNALYYLDQLRSTDPHSPDLQPLSQAVQTQIIARAAAALDSADLASADTLLHLAAGIGASPDLDALRDRLAQRKLANAAAAGAPATQLIVTKSLKVDYPLSALRDGTEGWVDLAYSVTTKGTVADIKVINASPRGVFEEAAEAALSRVRYKPVIRNGVPVTLRSNLRIKFQMAKQ